jgi:hypothetical protein
MTITCDQKTSHTRKGGIDRYTVVTPDGRELKFYAQPFHKKIYKRNLGPSTVETYNIGKLPVEKAIELCVKQFHTHAI